MQTVNEVIATGKIIATGKDRRGYSTVTIVIRGKKPAIVRFVVDNLSPSLSIGDNITVKGFTKAYSYQNEIQEKRTSVQYFVAQEIKKNNTELFEKFGVEGRYYYGSEFRAYVAGEVISRLDTRDPNWGKLTVKVDGVGVDKRPSYITFSYMKSRRLPPFDYERGDEVCLSASVSTPQKEFEGRTINFENLIVEDIVRTGQKETKTPVISTGFLDDLAGGAYEEDES